MHANALILTGSKYIKEKKKSTVKSQSIIDAHLNYIMQAFRYPKSYVVEFGRTLFSLAGCNCPLFCLRGE